jgi:Right handed beta helix region
MRTRGLAFVVAIVLSTAATSCSDDPPSSSASNADGGDGCPAGEKKNEAGKCGIVLPPATCAVGTMPRMGERECQPVGFSACAPGFVADESGWGCREVASATACKGATRDALGRADCAPVGDCGAPFPPKGARLFVSATGPVDATHFRSIESAALASRAGDVIAVDSGVYPGSVQIERPTTIVGRCAEKVILDGSDPTITTSGLIIDAQTTVRGITVRKFPGAAQLSAGLVVEDSVFDGNYDVGIYAEGTQITAKVVRSVIRNTVPRDYPTAFGITLSKGTTMDLVDSAIVASGGGNILAAPGNTIHIVSSVIRDGTTDTKGAGGYGFNGQGGSATIERSAFINNADTGVRSYKGASVTITDSVIRGTQIGALGRGYGLVAANGAKLEASRVAILDTHGVGVVVQGSTATLTDSVVRAQVTAPDGDFGDGIYAFGAAKLTVTNTAIVDNMRQGVASFDKDTETVLDRTLISGTKPVPDGTTGLGLNVAFEGHASLTSSAILDSRHCGIYVYEGGTLDVLASVIRNTQTQLAREPLGHGILATDSPHVTLVRSEIRKSAGVGLALAATPAFVAQAVIADNAVGIHVQDGSTLREVEASDDGKIAPEGLNVDVTKDTLFEGNGSKVGNGTIPLPAPLPHP